jgi:hypothetical protein
MVAAATKAWKLSPTFDEAGWCLPAGDDASQRRCLKLLRQRRDGAFDGGSPHPDFQEATYNLPTLLAIRQRRAPIRTDAIRRLLFALNRTLGRTWVRSHLCHSATFRPVLLDHLVSACKQGRRDVEEAQTV